MIFRLGNVEKTLLDGRARFSTVCDSVVMKCALYDSCGFLHAAEWISPGTSSFTIAS